MSFIGNMIKKTAKGFIVTTATAAAVSGISHLLKMSDNKVLQILGVGIPMMTFLAADDPSITDLIFKDSKKKKKNDGLLGRKEAEDNFFSIFGDKGHKMNKAIASMTDSTEDEVNGVMSLFFPSFVGAIAKEEPEDAGALNKMFKKETEAAEKKKPSLTRTFMKAIF